MDCPINLLFYSTEKASKRISTKTSKKIIPIHF